MQPTQSRRRQERTVVGETHDQAAGDDDTLPKEVAFDVLSNARRCHVLEYLMQSDERAVALRDLSEQLAAWENDIPIAEVGYKQRKRVHTSLYQTHLPKMADLEIIEYDRRSGVVRPTSTVNTLSAYLRSPDAIHTRLDRLGMGLAVLCSALVIASWLGPLPSVGYSGFGIALAVSTTFLFVSIAQNIDSLPTTR